MTNKLFNPNVAMLPASAAKQAKQARRLHHSFLGCPKKQEQNDFKTFYEFSAGYTHRNDGL
ncbi:MAG: hypothetical protein PHG47_07295 [Sulfuricella sp.]|nr:hypothetical protein [Sulfuricella sp.]